MTGLYANLVIDPSVKAVVTPVPPAVYATYQPLRVKPGLAGPPAADPADRGLVIGNAAWAAALTLNDGTDADARGAFAGGIKAGRPLSVPRAFCAGGLGDAEAALQLPADAVRVYYDVSSFVAYVGSNSYAGILPVTSASLPDPEVVDGYPIFKPSFTLADLSGSRGGDLYVVAPPAAIDPLSAPDASAQEYEQLRYYVGKLREAYTARCRRFRIVQLADPAAPSSQDVGADQRLDPTGLPADVGQFFAG